jgi:HlyD family secretion protein
MLSFLKKLFHKKIIIIVGLIVIVLAGYFSYKAFTNKNKETRYVLAQVKKGDISVTVSGSGQISASNQITLKPKASGTLVYLSVNNGQEVSKGTLIAKLDITTPQKTVRDAQIDLETAELNLEQAQQSSPVDETSLKRQAISAMATAVNNTKNIITSFQDIFFTDISSYRIDSKYLIDYYSHIVNFYVPQDVDYDTIITNNFDAIKAANTTNQTIFSYLDQNSSLAEIEDALNKITETTKLLNDTVHLGYQLLNRYESVLSDNNLTPTVAVRTIATDKSTILTYISSVDTNTTTLLNLQKSFISYRTSSSDITPATIRSLKLIVEQKQNALNDAKDKLTDYYVYAPFDGEISQLSVSKGDDVSSATSLAVLITKEKIAEITLTEIDLAKVKLGNVAQLTFDAVPDFTTTGKVIEIDPLGVESQGVVSYTIKVSLDKTDERLQPGMSVNAEITTNSKENVLMVNNSAIKTLTDKKYVEVVSLDNVSPEAFRTGITLTTTPKRQFIEVGLSDDDNSEIISGLNEGELVILKTTANGTTSNNKTTNTTRNMFNPNLNQTQRMFR